MIRGKNILLGVTGGIACYKVVDLCSRLIKQGANLKIIMTESATKFVTPLTFETMGKCKVYTDLFKGVHNEVHHVELAKWADLFIIAPLTANTLAKITYGIADNFLTASLLAYDKQIIIAPAMNSNMYTNVSTQKNLLTAINRGIKVIEPSEGLLACNVIGPGRMEEPENIVKFIDEYFTDKDLKNKKIIVTAGPTIAPIDYVRYVTNYSSGKMGYHIANEAKKRGANVILISGPVEPFKINGIKKISIKTNEDLQNEIEKEFDDSDALIMAAAPTDYKSKQVSENKIKKTGQDLHLDLEENIDILKSIASKKKKQLIIGFAAETNDLLKNAQKKLANKNADYIIANDLKKQGAGFDVETNIASIVSKDNIKELNIMTKRELANKILDLIK